MKGMRLEGGYKGWRVAEVGERKAPNSLKSNHLKGYTLWFIFRQLFKNNVSIECRGSLSGIVGVCHDGHA